jgi:hypothetical protein
LAITTGVCDCVFGVRVILVSGWCVRTYISTTHFTLGLGVGAFFTADCCVCVCVLVTLRDRISVYASGQIASPIT